MAEHLRFSEVLHRVFRARPRGRLASGQAELLDAGYSLFQHFQRLRAEVVFYGVVKTILQWKANLLPDEIVYGTKTGEILDPLQVGRLRHLGLVNKHNMHEFVKNADASGGSHVDAKWLQDHKGDEIRCRLAATQLAIGETLDVTQSTPPLMVARFLLAIASRHAQEITQR